MNTKYYKKYVEKLINTNPVEITVKRKITTPDGYGGYTTEDIDVNATITLYNKKARKQIITEQGVSYTGVTVTKLLALHDADIIEGDTFNHNGNKYKVSFAKSYLGICKQGELEVIK